MTTYKEMYDVLLQNGGISDTKAITSVVDNVLTKVPLSVQQSVDTKALTKSISLVCYKIRSKWLAAHRTRTKFETDNRDWLDTVFTFPTCDQHVPQPTCTGRPSKLFSEVSEHSKRRKVSGLRGLGNAQELALAAEMNARQDGNEDAAKLLHEIMQTSPSRPSRIRHILQENKAREPMTNNTADEALSLMIEADLSKQDYHRLRLNAKQHGCTTFYPSYEKVSEAKLRCMPEEAHITVTEKCAEVTLQALLDHTTSRIVTLQTGVIESLGAQQVKLILRTKWGFDGSSGQSRYKQKFQDGSLDDSSILISSLVPLQLTVQDEKETVIWHNIKSSSTRLCRPIRLQFEKESIAITKREYENITDQIKLLTPTEIQVSPTLTVTITHSLHCTMIDGKVCSALTDISVQRCIVCGGYPREFNNLELMRQKVPDVSAYEFGISPLHAYIRFMECALHIAYRVEFKVTQAKTPEHKILMANRRQEIQDAFKDSFGLMIDMPKQGSGSTNDGNSARRFFQTFEKTADILKLDVELIRKFSVILTTLNSGFFINTERFREFCWNTAKLYVQLYGWYKMPPAVHRVLFHGADIAAHFHVPIGTLSEEPQECRNKDIKRFREHRARKCSRLATNVDVFRRLMISSDPTLSSYRKVQSPKFKAFPETVQALLREPPSSTSSVNLNSSDDEDEDLL